MEKIVQMCFIYNYRIHDNLMGCLLVLKLRALKFPMKSRGLTIYNVLRFVIEKLLFYCFRNRYDEVAPM